MLSTGMPALVALPRAAVTLAFLAGLLIVLRQRVTTTGLYVLLYVAVVMVHILKRNYEPSRHLVPILPLRFCYTIVGARAAARWITGRLGRRIAPLLAATAVGCVSVYLWHGFHALANRVPQEHQSPFGSLQNNLLRHTTVRPGRFRLIAELPHASLYQVLPVVD
jgi:hypothetical protein